jgi:hypothetical protein
MPIILPAAAVVATGVESTAAIDLLQSPSSSLSILPFNETTKSNSNNSSSNINCPPPLIIALSSSQLSAYAQTAISSIDATTSVTVAVAAKSQFTQASVGHSNLTVTSQSSTDGRKVKKPKKAATKSSLSSQSIRRLVSIRPHPASSESPAVNHSFVGLSSDESCKPADIAPNSTSTQLNKPDNIKVIATNESTTRCRKRKRSIKLCALIEEKANQSSLDKSELKVNEVLSKQKEQQPQQQQQQPLPPKKNNNNIAKAKKYSNVRIRSIDSALNKSQYKLEENECLESYCSLIRPPKLKLTECPERDAIFSQLLLSPTNKSQLKAAEKSDFSHSLFGK